MICQFAHPLSNSHITCANTLGKVNSVVGSCFVFEETRWNKAAWTMPGNWGRWITIAVIINSNQCANTTPPLHKSTQSSEWPTLHTRTHTYQYVIRGSFHSDFSLLLLCFCQRAPSPISLLSHLSFGFFGDRFVLISCASPPRASAPMTVYDACSTNELWNHLGCINVKHDKS